MRIKLLVVSLITAALIGGFTVQGQSNEGHDHGGKKESKMTEKEHGDHGMDQDPEGMIEVGNKICPVSGEKVGEMGDVITYEYNGKIYNLCCAMCAKDFKKNPEKYSKIAEDEVKNNDEMLEDFE